MSVIILYLCIHYVSMKIEKTSFPLNAWYAAAYDIEVKSALLARTVCNQKLVMFRQSDGTAAVLQDACGGGHSHPRSGLTGAGSV